MAAIAPVVVCFFNDTPVPALTRALAAALWVLALVPMFLYLGQNQATRRPIPFLPALSLMFGLYYVLPLTLGVVDNYYNAPVFPETDYDYPVQLAFLGFVSMMAAYVTTGLFLTEKKPPRQLVWNVKILTRWGFLLMFAGIASAGLRTLFLSATLVGGVFQFLLGIQWLGTGILTILARRNELSRLHLSLLLGGFAVSSAMMVSHGSIAPMLMLFLIGGFAVWIGRPEIPARWLVAALVALLIASSFRGIAIDFRRATFAQQAQVSQIENLKLMVSLLGRRIDNEGFVGAIGHGLATTAGRSANMDLFANLVRRTPSEVPYWRGETYKSLIGFAVPRFLWPSKPTKDLGQAFGHRYQYIHASNKSTAINLPVLVEFFANFGEMGVILGMMVVGVIYRSLDSIVNRARQSPLLSMIGVSLLLPLLFIESDFSLIFGGIPLNGIAFYLVWRQFRKSLDPRRARARASTKFGAPTVGRGLGQQRLAQQQVAPQQLAPPRGA